MNIHGEKFATAQDILLRTMRSIHSLTWIDRCNGGLNQMKHPNILAIEHFWMQFIEAKTHPPWTLNKVSNSIEWHSFHSFQIRKISILYGNNIIYSLKVCWQNRRWINEWPRQFHVEIIDCFLFRWKFDAISVRKTPNKSELFIIFPICCSRCCHECISTFSHTKDKHVHVINALSLQFES